MSRSGRRDVTEARLEPELAADDPEGAASGVNAQPPPATARQHATKK
jgi:hypothetical protein